MSQGARKTRPPNTARRANAARLPNEYRQKLMAAGADLFVKHGIDAVSVEQLLEEAEISRATFYGCFANKKELVAAIISPVFESGISAMATFHDLNPTRAADSLIEVYLDLWRNHRTALLLTGRLDATVFPYIRRQHDAFNTELLKVLAIVESGGLLRTNNAELTLNVLGRTAIPLLRIYKDREQFEPLFRESIRGLILTS